MPRIRIKRDKSCKDTIVSQNTQQKKEVGGRKSGHIPFMPLVKNLWKGTIALRGKNLMGVRVDPMGSVMG